MLKRRSNILGFQEGGANVDPVSGNDVPTGSMPEEVRDDIDAKLSPGEFVLPADVVRFIGLERLMKMRDEAKKGLQRMSDIGQMGNADEVGEESNSTYEDEGFESEIDDILSEIEAEENGKDVNEQTEVMMAEGGFMKSGTDLTKAPKNPVFDVRYYKNAEGSVMYITHINGKPMTPIPEGYKAVTQEEAQKVGQKAEEEEAKKKPTQDDYGYSDTPQLGRDLTPQEEAKRDEQLGKVNTFLTKAAPFVIPGVALAQKAGAFLKGKEQEQAATLAGTMAYQRASEDPRLSEQDRREIEKQASEAAAIFSRSGMDTQKAARTAVEEQQNLRDIEADQGRVGTPEPTPTEFTTGDWGGLAKGGLVAKRQYPTKKKKGKGIAASK
jgi:Arc/MetJ-type ribon-helix-helix transcriptional regulator